MAVPFGGLATSLWTSASSLLPIARNAAPRNPLEESATALASARPSQCAPASTTLLISD